MSAPAFLFLATLAVAALSAWNWSKPPRAAALAAAGSLALAAWALFSPIDAPFSVIGLAVKLPARWSLLGRGFVLDEGARPMIAFLYLATAFLTAPSFLAGTTRAAPALAVMLTGIVAASLMVTPFVYAALFIELAALGSGMMLVSRSYPSSAGALRLLSLYTFAMMGMLATGWLLDRVGVTASTPELANVATMLLILSFAILMAVPPFHLWISAAAQRANPHSMAFVIFILQSAGLFFALRFLDGFPWLRMATLAYQALLWTGAVAAIAGALMAMAAEDMRQVGAFALVSDAGVILLAVGTGEPAGYRLALGMLAARVVALGLLGLGLGSLGISQPWGSMQGSGKTMPLQAAAFLAGLLSLAGFPLSAGFPGRWSLMSGLHGAMPWTSWTILTAMTLLTGTVISWARRLFAVPAERASPTRLTRLEQLFLGGGIFLLLLLGIFPQLVYPWVVEMANGLSNLVP